MKIVVFGLTVSSRSGNGHASLWRGLIKALAARGHYVVFFEQDVPHYAQTRDLWQIPGGELILYRDWEENLPSAKQHLQDADVSMVTSRCPDGIAATELTACSRVRIRCFYDLDTSMTLTRWKRGEIVDYLSPRGLRDFDLVLSCTGGKALHELKAILGAKRAAPLYRWADPSFHRPSEPRECYRGDLSYLGTYADDRQNRLQKLFIDAARQLPDRPFVIGGSDYPDGFPWTPNTSYVQHLPPDDQASFFSSSRLTLNVTRKAEADYGYCPSSRLFEAAACGTPLLSDAWDGLQEFFLPGEEIIVAEESDDTVKALSLTDAELRRMAAAARDRTLEEHTAKRRVLELENALRLAPSSYASTPPMTAKSYPRLM